MNSIWMGLGFVGQAVFGGRFFVQWIPVNAPVTA